jgi:hypothetical protein
MTGFVENHKTLLTGQDLSPFTYTLFQRVVLLYSYCAHLRTTRMLFPQSCSAQEFRHARSGVLWTYRSTARSNHRG